MAGACTDAKVIGEGQFSRPIELASNPSDPLPRLAWRPDQGCPGPIGGCESFCEDQPDSCDRSACLPLLIDSGTPLSILPSSDGTLSFSQGCVELRSAGGLLDTPNDPETLAATTASFRLVNAPLVFAPGSEFEGWGWTVGDESPATAIGGVIGGNILRDFAIELRHLSGERATVAFFSDFPGTETVLANQGRAYVRLQYPGRLLGRLLSDHCELGPGLDCRLSTFNLNQDDQDLLFESTRALVDACVAPPPCAVSWTEEADDPCGLSTGGLEPQDCSDDHGQNATLVVATGVPGLVLFDDSAIRLLGDLDQLPSCAALVPNSDSPACTETNDGRLSLPGWPALEGLQRLRVRSLGLVQGLDQPSGATPCQRLRDRLEGLVRQCEGFDDEGRPVRPAAQLGVTVGASAAIIGEVALEDDISEPDVSAWLHTLVIPETAAPVIALRREVVPEGAQPDGLIGGALLANTETVLDFTESVESPGVRVRCLDPGPHCLAAPACESDGGELTSDFDAGQTGCCFGLPPELIARVVLDGEDKEAPRVEDACCSALPRAAILDLQSPGLDLCTDVELP